MAFEWNRMYKWEENHERNITEDIEEYICEHYGLDTIEQLTLEQYKEVKVFYEEMNEYSIMRLGFSNIFNYWETYREDEGLDIE